MVFIFRSTSSVLRLRGRIPRLRSKPSENGSGRGSCHPWSQEQRLPDSDRSAQSRGSGPFPNVAERHLCDLAFASVGSLLVGAVLTGHVEEFPGSLTRPRSSW